MLYSKEVDHVLNEEVWLVANQKLLAKMLAEYKYEGMIHPEVTGESENGKVYELMVSDGKKYRFTAKPRLFDSLDVEPHTVEVSVEGNWVKAKSAIELLLDIQPMIGMSAETAGHLIKELNHTLLADAHLLMKDSNPADELIHEDYSKIEGEMSGHPWITYNKGRIGFGYDDYLAFAPENQQEVKLLWIAVHKDNASFQSVEGLTFEKVIEDELDETEVSRFEAVLAEKGLKRADYFFMPIHEWQWKNVIIQTFPEDLAMDRIIALGEGDDRYLPQQSIRTFANQTDKTKNHVKVPMSILNTLVYRGLPSERTLIAPRITAFIKGIYENDPFLKEECRVILPGEIASINYAHPQYEQLKHAPYQYLEMLGVIWRESIYTYLEEGEQAVTLAALNHVDKNGKPFIHSLVEQSGLTAEEWMKDFFGIVMNPLLHYLYQYGTVFSPHGQNTILVLKNHKPYRLAVKDFVDDVNISDQPFEELSGLTDDLKAVLRSEPPEGLTQFIFTGLFICHLRYLSNVLDRSGLMNERTFWGLLARSIKDYQAKFPELEERFKLFDFFKPELTKLCLNRNRMVDYGYAEGDDRPHASEFGKVDNGLALFQLIEK
ncbi:IucA/IucC family protein [Pseudalkalibacillus salsuginis]|uniref:IucA/IucC family protein n=1 Tax=Pseudalkalibacillus salsuginis TaxID=2910972 RepID=UPI001F3721A6|nr:IucA/IucC family siderophore biosynthesis protein [Pseudalkalibacillus salsuginis]MCF6409366.1 IucA/IucC family siderophore biosynthesis protein [Pseudalkalibacillus salsuginis]